VTLKGTSFTNKTDTSGAHIFKNVPARTYTVVATFHGHEFLQQVSLPLVPSSPSDIVLDMGAVDRLSRPWCRKIAKSDCLQRGTGRQHQGSRAK